MTVRSKSNALIRDIAQLFVRYSPKDWEVVLGALQRDNGVQLKIAEAIRALQNSAPAKRKEETKTRRTRGMPEFKSLRATLLQGLDEGLKAKSILPRANQLKNVYLTLGGKANLPQERGAAIRFFLEFLNNLPDPDFEQAIAVLRSVHPADRSALAEEYSRWFNLIQSGTRRSGS